MSSPKLRQARPPISLVERAQRLREKMIATALVELEDWSPLPPLDPALPEDDASSPPPTRFEPPPVRWRDGDDRVRDGGKVIAGESVVAPAASKRDVSAAPAGSLALARRIER